MTDRTDIIVTAVIALFGGGGLTTLGTALFNARKNKVSIEVAINDSLLKTLKGVQEQYELVRDELTEVRDELEALRVENTTLKAQIGKCEHRLDSE